MRKIIAGLLAFACCSAAFVGANVQGFKTGAETQGKTEVTPLIETSFSDGTVGSNYDVFQANSGLIWDDNYTVGTIVDEFDGKAYQFTNQGTGVSGFGGIKLTNATLGKSYTLSMNIKISGMDFLWFEYVSDTAGWGAINLYENGKIGNTGGANMTVSYDAKTSFLTATVTHGMNGTEAGFFKLTSANGTEGSKVVIDNVKVTEATSLLNETWEDKTVGAYDSNASFCNFWYDGTTTSIVENGGDKALSVTGTSTEFGYRTMGYLNRLGFLQNEKTYRISFDYEIIDASKLFIEYTPSAGGAGLEINVDTGIAYCWGNDANLKNYSIVTDGNNAKGTVSFDWKIFENLREFRLMTYGANSSSQSIIIDNIKVDYIRNDLDVSVVGNGKVTAYTFAPVSGSNATINVVPDNGYQVKSFKVDGTETVLTNNAYTFAAVSADHKVEVEFTEAIPEELRTLVENFSKTFTMVNGASIRLSEPAGIRFRAQMGLNEYTALAAFEGVTLSFGTLVVPEDYTTLPTLDGDYVKLDIKQTMWNDEEGLKCYNAAIVKIKDGNLDRNFVARGYMQYTYNGVTYTVYTQTATPPRSIYGIASKIMNNAEIKANYTENQHTVMQNIIDKVEGK